MDAKALLEHLKEGWNIAKRWYRAASERAPKPCYVSMETQTNERVELYEERIPDRDPIPINVDPFDVKDETPTDTELRCSVRTRLKSGRSVTD